ncbi:polyadenylate-binding protein RBP47B' isoform X2 [Selaginella moellendorffii]|uniref:polyadenylate-binding protein RBP47B' isoform X2 n=1 Tax=Selaginella moellendorffii TaxID=88036 RepID=UPI000D1CCC1A|nr:polyadenylate-binding protein RBP47B' isoform X2 [Selaginella moellendorffii]|eukprot:XP_024539827.1 polyadenylate-binding protein RBP47B' isoform X2 [Selaginella moellendorffii]
MHSPDASAQQWSQQPPIDMKTLWVGDLQYWMDESYLNSIFSSTGEQLVSAKIIRNKASGFPEGYGFVEFASHACAERVLTAFTGTQMPQTEQLFRLNWAYFGIGERRPEGGPENSIFVGDLAPDVTDYMLQETFRTRYPSVRGAKVVTDVATGRSKGYGFVRFADDSERVRAMSEMNGIYCSSRPMRINAATPKKALIPSAPAPQKVTTFATSPLQNVPNDNDPNNTTIFVGGLDPAVSEEELQKTFGEFGELVYVKIPPGKGCGFVQFTHRSCAEEALGKLHGTMIRQQAIRLSWGRTANKQYPAGWGGDPSQGYYGYGYDGYGYTQGQDSTYSYAGYQGYQGYGGYMQPGDPYAMYDPNNEVFDPLTPPDIDTLNAAYIVMHEPFLVGRHLSLPRSTDTSQPVLYSC